MPFLKQASPSGAPSAPSIRPAAADEIASVAALFRDYEAWLGVSLCFQGFEEELAGLPGTYAPPAGGLWLAWDEGRPVGVVGLRPLAEDGDCEMKRLWVEPGVQGRGLGWRLAETCIAAARERGYRRMRLDTLPKLGKAIEIYRAMGFAPSTPYNDNPMPGVLFMEKDLAQGVTERA